MYYYSSKICGYFPDIHSTPELDILKSRFENQYGVKRNDVTFFDKEESIRPVFEAKESTESGNHWFSYYDEKWHYDGFQSNQMKAPDYGDMCIPILSNFMCLND